MLSAARVAVLVASLLLLPLPQAGLTATAATGHPLSPSDRRDALVISRLAARHSNHALSWARTRPSIRFARASGDGKSLEIGFHDGANLVVLPPIQRPGPSLAGTGSDGAERYTSHRGLTQQVVAVRQQAGNANAAVLEPFATELGQGSSAGQQEADALTSAGFKVDVFRNKQVTVKLMGNLSQYSVVYMETHSYVAPMGGDAIVATGETNTAPYLAMFKENSLAQVLVAGDPQGNLYNGIRAKWVTEYMGTFPDSSLLILNGCSMLRDPVFWQALAGRNVSTMITWDQEVDAGAAERGAQYLVPLMVQGESVSQAVDATVLAGYGVANTANGPAHMAYFGSGDIRLADALDKATPTSTPTNTPGPSPTPTVTQRPKPTRTPRPTPRPTTKAKKATPTPTRVQKHPKGHKHKPPKCKRGYHLVKGKCRRTTHHA